MRNLKSTLIVLIVLAAASAADAQTRDRLEPGVPVPSRDSLGVSDAPRSLNPGLRDDPNSPIGPTLGTVGAAPDGSLDPTSGTMANPSQ